MKVKWVSFVIHNKSLATIPVYVNEMTSDKR